MVESRRISRRNALATFAGAVAGAVALPVLPARAAQPTTAGLNMLPLQITGINLQNGQLVALGNIGSTPISLPLTLTPGAVSGNVSILNLQLGAINLNLLGLNVTTSPICLAISANPNGGLLGSLLAGLANALNGGLSLGAILGNLTPAQLGTLLSGLTSLLNGVLGQLTSASSVAGASCPILNLALGPVDLTLLGLNVHLDNCSNGPVTLDITAIPGAGNLLGNLLCSLANVLNGPANGTAVAALLRNISREITQLLG